LLISASVFSSALELTSYFFQFYSSKRDKNKELEARNAELDRKLREERILREKAVAESLVLVTRLKETKGVEPDRTVLKEDYTSRHIGDSASKLDLTKRDVVTKEYESTAPNSTGVATQSTSSMMQSTKRNSSSSDVTRTAGSSMTRATTDETTMPKISSLQKDRGENGGGPMPDVHFMDSLQLSQSITQPPVSTGVTASDISLSAPAKDHSTSGHVVESVPVNSVSNGDVPLQSLVDANNSVVGASSGIIKHFNEGGSDPTRFATRDVSPSKANLQVAQQSPLKHNESSNVLSTRTCVPTQQQMRNGEKNPSHRPSQSLHEFDPLSSHHHVASNSETALPGIPIPISYIRPVPLNAFSPGTMPITDINGTFMSPNPFVVPLAFEMTPSPSVMNESQPFPTDDGPPLMSSGFSGYQQPQFLVLPQQQPIMIQSVGSAVQIVSDMNGGQWVQGTSFPGQEPPITYPHLSASHQTHYQQRTAPPRHHVQQAQRMANQGSQPQAHKASNPYDPLFSR
jgi:hypothetical protein